MRLQAFEKRDKDGRLIILLPIIDPHHQTGCLVSSLRYQLRHGLVNKILLLQAKVLLEVARKHGFVLIQRILRGLEDVQDKLKEAEVITCTAFQDAVEQEGHAEMAQSLRDLAGLIDLFDKAELEPRAL